MEDDIKRLREEFTQKMAEELVNVQPMGGAVGSIFVLPRVEEPNYASEEERIRAVNRRAYEKMKLRLKGFC